MESKSIDRSTSQSPELDHSPSLLKGLPTGSFARREETDDGWTLIRSQSESRNITKAILASFSSSDSSSPAITDISQRIPEWKDGDFPPLESRPSLDKDEVKQPQPLLG